MKLEEPPAFFKLKELNERIRIVRGSSSAGKTIAILCLLIHYAGTNKNKK